MVSTRPTCILTKAERKKANQLIDVTSRYREICKGIYQWGGLPEDVPDGFIEEALFDVGCVSAKTVNGIGVCIFPASPSTYGIYGEPASWMPSAINSTSVKDQPILADMMTESYNPCLYFDESVYTKISPFLSILNESLLSLKQNAIILRQPIMLDGTPGNGANAQTLMGEIKNGETFIPCIDLTRQGFKIIESNAQDHMQSFITSYNAMDTEILSIIGVKNRGTEKLSGITSEETLSITQELSIKSDAGLKVRQRWCDKINAVLGTNFTVEIAEAFIMEDSDSDSIPDSLDRDGKVPEEL